MKLQSAVLRIWFGKELLLLQRHDFDHSVSGWCLPGGKVDEGEEVLHALNRELLEETGLVVFAPEEIGSYETTLKSRKIQEEIESIVTVFEMRLPAKPNITLSDEHCGFGWFTIEEIERLEQKKALAGKTWTAINIK